MSRRRPDLRGIETRRRRRRDGTVLVTYRVRWTGPDGARESRSFDDVEAAIELRDELDRRAALLAEGPAARRTMTVADCYEQWRREHVLPELAERTRRNYEGVWRRHLAARVGDQLAIDVRPRHIKALRGDMLADGLGAQTTRKALQVLGHIFTHALELDVVDINPVMQIRKPRAPKPQQAPIVEIAVVERMRAYALGVERSPLTAVVIAIDPSSPFRGARCWATASGCPSTSSTRACSSARWPRGARSAGSRRRRFKPHC